MKRHPALVSLSRDHHQALAASRGLRRAADLDHDPAAAAKSFVSFFASETAPHFREEEEVLFPLVADFEEARPLLVEALLDHQRLRALVAQLETVTDVRSCIREIGELLAAHVRREERELFPLIERLAAAELERATLADAKGGPVWGQASDELVLLAVDRDCRGAVDDEHQHVPFVVDVFFRPRAGSPRE